MAQYVEELRNLSVSPKGKTLNVRKGTSTKSAVVATIKQGETAGKTTGFVTKESDGDWYQIILSNGAYAYVRSDVIKLSGGTASSATSESASSETTAASSKVTISQTKDVINKLVQTDIKVYDKLVNVGLLLVALTSKKYDVSAYQKQYSTLSNRLTARQNEIKNSKVLKYKAGVKKGFEKAIESMSNFDGSTLAGIGAIPAVIVLSVVAGATLTVAAYYMFKPKYDESKADLKVSTELEAALKNVDPETAQKIKTDLNNQIDTAYNQGKTDNQFSGMWSILKPLGIAAAGYFLITKFVLSQKSK